MWYVCNSIALKILCDLDSFTCFTKINTQSICGKWKYGLL